MSMIKPTTIESLLTTAIRNHFVPGTTDPARWVAHCIARSNEPNAEPITMMIMLTPALARVLLGMSLGNRALSNHNLNRIAAALRDGEWRLTHQGLGVSRTGRLIDGHHRCQAVINTEIPMATLITFGVEDEVFAKVDIGRARRPGDALSYMGTANATSVAAIARVMIGVLNSRNLGQAIATKRAMITNQDVVTFVEQHPAIEQVVVKSDAARRHFKYLRAGFGAALTMIVEAGADVDDVSTFADLVATGLGLPAGATSHPVYRLRAIMENMSSQGVRGEEHAAWTVKAWNAYVLGQEVRLISWKAGEAFPAVIARKS